MGESFFFEEESNVEEKTGDLDLVTDESSGNTNNSLTDQNKIPVFTDYYKQNQKETVYIKKKQLFSDQKVKNNNNLSNEQFKYFETAKVVNYTNEQNQENGILYNFGLLFIGILIVALFTVYFLQRGKEK